LVCTLSPFSRLFGEKGIHLSAEDGLGPFHMVSNEANDTHFSSFRSSWGPQHLSTPSSTSRDSESFHPQQQQHQPPEIPPLSPSVRANTLGDAMIPDTVVCCGLTLQSSRDGKMKIKRIVQDGKGSQASSVLKVGDALQEVSPQHHSFLCWTCCFNLRCGASVQLKG
jgi:hypothetical protein